MAFHLLHDDDSEYQTESDDRSSETDDSAASGLDEEDGNDLTFYGALDVTMFDANTTVAGLTLMPRFLVSDSFVNA
jgi:hypothetical protein